MSKSIIIKNKKCIVLDLDNTLWGGIVGEDGLDGITLGQDGEGKIFQDFQWVIKLLAREGIIIALASKNEENDINEVFEKHPGMILDLKDISAKRPANGIPPIYLDKVIGKKAKKNFKKEELIKL